MYGYLEGFPLCGAFFWLGHMMIPEERQKGCESMNLTRISICRNQVFLGEGLEQRLSWKISETLAVQILELDGECYLLHVIQIMYHSSQARQPRNQTSKKIRKAFLLALLLQP